MERVVKALFERPMLRTEVLERLRVDSALSASLLREALALAERAPEDAVSLSWESWRVVRAPDRERGAYDRALRMSEAACRQERGDGSYLNALGAAQYRVGRYHESVETLTQAGRLSAVADGSSLPANLAFLAMARHRSGRSESARATLKRLRIEMAKPQWAQDDEARALLREAEAIEMDLVFPGAPFAR